MSKQYYLLVKMLFKRILLEMKKVFSEVYYQEKNPLFKQPNQQGFSGNNFFKLLRNKNIYFELLPKQEKSLLQKHQQEIFFFQNTFCDNKIPCPKTFSRK